MRLVNREKLDFNVPVKATLDVLVEKSHSNNVLSSYRDRAFLSIPFSQFSKLFDFFIGFPTIQLHFSTTVVPSACGVLMHPNITVIFGGLTNYLTDSICTVAII